MSNNCVICNQPLVNPVTAGGEGFHAACAVERMRQRQEREALAADVVMEPRWLADGTTRVNGPLVRLVPPHEIHDARNCGNLPQCWRCGRVIDRSGSFHSFRTEYLEPQPTGDIVRDYVHGGAIAGAHAQLCGDCCPACKVQP